MKCFIKLPIVLEIVKKCTHYYNYDDQSAFAKFSYIVCMNEIFVFVLFSTKTAPNKEV